MAETRKIEGMTPAAARKLNAEYSITREVAATVELTVGSDGVTYGSRIPSSGNPADLLYGAEDRVAVHNNHTGDPVFEGTAGELAGWLAGAAAKIQAESAAELKSIKVFLAEAVPECAAHAAIDEGASSWTIGVRGPGMGFLLEDECYMWMRVPAGEAGDEDTLTGEFIAAAEMYSANDKFREAYGNCTWEARELIDALDRSEKYFKEAANRLAKKGGSE